MILVPYDFQSRIILETIYTKSVLLSIEYNTQYGNWRSEVARGRMLCDCVCNLVRRRGDDVGRDKGILSTLFTF